MFRLTMFCTDAAAALNSELSWLDRLTEKFLFSMETLAVYCWTSRGSRTHTLYSTHTHFNVDSYLITVMPSLQLETWACT